MPLAVAIAQPTENGDPHDRLGLVDARRVPVQRAVDTKGRQADADHVHDQRRPRGHMDIQPDVVEQQRAQVGKQHRNGADQ
jgi:hypothetical protein